MVKKELSQIRFLVVDDSPMMRKVLTDNLTKMGVQQIIQAEDGRIALDKLESSYRDGKPIEIILCDWNMPNMDGEELLLHIREHIKFKSIPFVMITVVSDVEKVQKAVELGVSNYPEKPFEPSPTTVEIIPVAILILRIR